MTESQVSDKVESVGVACLAMILLLSWLQPLEALTVYRIGGDELPLPEMETAFDFVQISWDDIDPQRHGSRLGVLTDGGSPVPLRFTPETNLAPILRTWGGQVRFYESGYGPFAPIPATDDQAFVFDDDPSTAFLGREHLWWAVTAFWGFDLGVPIPVTRIRLTTREEFATSRFVQWFEMYAASRPGQFAGKVDAGQPDLIFATRENVDAVFEISLPGTLVRELGIWVRPPAFKPWEISEIEIYSSGFIPEARYRTNIIDLEEVASVGGLTWSGDTGPGAHIGFSVRGGDDDDPNLYHRNTFRNDEQVIFGSAGEILSRALYDKLDPKQRGAITYDTANWELWNGPDAKGAVAGSGRPRRFIQFDVTLTSTVERSGRLDYLQFAASKALATSLVAEIEPARVKAGAATSFAYRFRPQLEPDDPGFDTIAIDTPLQPLSVEGVRLNGTAVDYTTVRLDDAGLAVRIPHMDVTQTMELIEVLFRAEVFEYGTQFSGRVYDSARPGEMAQPILGGDADELSDSNGLTVALEKIPTEAIHAVRLSSAVFSPNGDGVNDALQVEYELLNLRGGTALNLTVYDLSGRKIREINGGTVDNGRGRIAWDGTGNEGLVEPGIYVLQLRVATDSGEENAQRVVSVVY